MTAIVHRTASPVRHMLALGALAVALFAGVAFAPQLVAEATSTAHVTVADLPETVSHGFDAWVASGAAQPGDELASAAQFWQVFHAIKAALALAVVAVLAAFQALMWRWLTRAESGPRRSALALAGTVGAGLLALALVLVVANVQGTVAPLSSVLSFLPAGDPTPAMSGLREQVIDTPLEPIPAAFIADFRAYHLTVVIAGAWVLEVLAAAVALLWVAWVRLPRGTRRVRDLLIPHAALVLAIAGIGLIVAANLSTTIQPAPALAAFLAGGA